MFVRPSDLDAGMSHVPRVCSTTHSSSRKVRVVIIGNSGVGKSSSISRFVDGVSDFNLIHTIGIDFKSKIVEIDSKSVELQLWDTAGQERFHSLTPAFIRDALGIVLMYDVTDSKSFDAIAFWMTNIREHARLDVEIMLLGSKIDLEHDRVVTKDMGVEAARRIDAWFFEVSAVTGHNVERAFEALAKFILIKKGFCSENVVSISTDSVGTIRLSEKPASRKTCCGQVSS